MIEYNRTDKMGMLMVDKFKGHLMQEMSEISCLSIGLQVTLDTMTS
jgi:hypothetical protein